MIKNMLRKIVSNLLAIMILLIPAVDALGSDIFVQASEISDYGYYGGQIYYVDSFTGNDSNDGLSTDHAWKSLDRVNQQEYQPGDQILFKSGGVWSGRIMPKGSGTEGQPIIIGKYGGNARPIINGSSNLLDGSKEGSTILLYNQDYWEIYDLEITNKSSSGAASCLGIWVVNEDYGTANHFVISGNYIHSLTASARTEVLNTVRANGGLADMYNWDGVPRGAIQFTVLVGNEKIPSKFNDVQVVNNEVANVERTGFNIGSDWGDHQASGYMDDKVEQLYFSTNIYVANNIFRNTAAAVTMFHVDGSVGRGCIVEKNVCYDNNNGYSYWVMWCGHTIDLIFQYNEIYNMYLTSGQDDGIFDADGQSVGTIFQYNYTHHNAGPVLMFCDNNWEHSNYAVHYVRSCAYRYNISYNDNWLGIREKGTLGEVGSGQGYIYNNLIYTEGYDVTLFQTNGSGSYISNNIFYSTGDGNVTYSCGTNGIGNTNVYNNCFYGLSSELPKSNEYTNASGNFAADPKILLPTGMSMGSKSGISTGPADITEILSKGYFKLQPDSSCIGAGQIIENNGGRDFFGNNLSTVAAPDIGPHQYTEVPAVSGTITLSASEVTTETVKLEWQKFSQTTAVSKYEIYLNGGLAYTVNSSHRKTSDFDLLGPKEGNADIFAANCMKLEELLPGAQYEIYVRAYSGDGTYIQSNTVTLMTTALTAGEEELYFTQLTAYKYDDIGNTNTLCTDFNADDTVRFKTTVTDGAGRPVKGVVVRVMYEAESLDYTAYDVAISDSNGVVWIGCRTPDLPKEEFQYTATVWSVEKAGYTFGGNAPSIAVKLHGYDEKYSANPLVNPDFSKIGENGLPSSWSYVGSKYMLVVNTLGPEGEQNVLEVRTEESTSVRIRQTISYLPNGTYTLSAWVRNTNPEMKLEVSNTGDNKSISVPVSEEWTQVVLKDVQVSINRMIISVTVNTDGNYEDYTQICNFELTRNLLYNTDLTVLYPSNVFELPANFYYETDNTTINVGDTDLSAAEEDVNLKAVGLQYYAGTEYKNALHISSDEAFEVVMGQKKTSLASGKYTFSASISNVGSIEGALRIRDGVSGAVLASKPIACGQRYETVQVTAEVTSGSAYVELCFKGGGKQKEYIDILNMSFANRSTLTTESTMVVLPGQNLFDKKNGDFEDDGSATYAIASGWDLNDFQGCVDAYVTDEDKHTGNYSIKFTLDEKYYHNIDNAQYSAGGVNPVDGFHNLPAGTYQLSVWIRSNFRMKFVVNVDNRVRTWEFYTTADDKWHEYVVDNITVEDGELDFNNWAQRSLSDNPKDGSVLYAYIDSISLTKKEDVTVRNGNAEEVNEDMPVNWTVAESSGHAKLISTKESVEGEKAAMAVLPGQDSSLTLSCIVENTKSGTYSFSSKIRGSGKVKISIETDGSTESYTLETIAEDNWKQIEINDIQMNVTGNQLLIKVENQTGITSSFVSFDDMVIQEPITSQMVAETLPGIKGVEPGEDLILPKPVVEGYTVSIYASSDTSVVDLDGKVTTHEDTKFITLTLEVTNNNDPTDTASISRYVTVYGWGNSDSQ